MVGHRVNSHYPEAFHVRYKSKRKPSVFYREKKNVPFSTSVDTKIVNLAFVEARELYCGIFQPALCPRSALASELISQSILSRGEQISMLHDSP